MGVEEQDAVGAAALQLHGQAVGGAADGRDAGAGGLVQHQGADGLRGLVQALHDDRHQAGGAEHDHDAHHDRHDDQGSHQRLPAPGANRGMHRDMEVLAADTDGIFSAVVPPAAAGRRADRFLADAIGTLSRSRVKALIEAGHVSCGEQTLREPAAAVRTGQLFVLRPPAPVAASPLPQDIALPILFEDADLIVLDKPAGLVVHPAPGNQDGTLVNALLAHCGDTLPGIGGERRPGIVHRLDKDTSGVMVVAKTELALATLSAAFAARDLDPRLSRPSPGDCRRRRRTRSKARSAAIPATASAWRWSRAAARRR